jgi:hypothetical protein
MPTDSSEPPPLELTIVVEPYQQPWEPPPPTTVPPRVPVDALVTATAVAALVFSCLTWWAVG